MEECIDTTSFPKTKDQIRNEHQVSFPLTEGRSNVMSYPDLDPLQNKLTIPSTACIPSANETKIKDNKDDCELIENLTGMEGCDGRDRPVKNKGENKQKIFIYGEFNSNQLEQGPETNSQLMFNGNSQFIKNKALVSLNTLKSMPYNTKQQITLEHVNVMKEMVLSKGPRNLKITLGSNLKMFDPMNVYNTSDNKSGLLTRENSVTNQVCIDFKGDYLTNTVRKVKQNNPIEELSPEKDSPLQLCQKLPLGTCSVESSSIETHDEAGTICSGQLYDPMIPSRCINNVSNFTFTDVKNTNNIGHKFVGQFIPSINVGTHVQMFESQSIPAFSENTLCISELSACTGRFNYSTKNNQPLENNFVDVNGGNCFAEISKNSACPITKIKMYAEIETSSDNPSQLFQTFSELLNVKSYSSSTIMSNSNTSFHPAVTNTKYESINTLNQETFHSHMDEIPSQKQTLQYERALSIVNLDHDYFNGEVEVLNENINSKSENIKEQDSADINSLVSDEFSSNNSSPLNISIREEISKALSILNANLENENLEINKETSMEPGGIWNDSEIDEAINDSIEKYVHSTAEKCILAAPSTSEKMCQTDISSFNRHLCKRLLKFDDDCSPLKRSKLSFKTEAKDELANNFSTSDNSFLTEGIKIAEELINTEEFEIMNNKDICWSPEMPSESGVMPIIYQEKEKRTDELNNDKSLFDEEELEDGQLNWSSTTCESETMEWDQLVPLPRQETKSDKVDGNDPVTEDKSGFSGSSINQDYTQPSTSTYNNTTTNCRKTFGYYIPSSIISYNSTSSEDSSD